MESPHGESVRGKEKEKRKKKKKERNQENRGKEKGQKVEKIFPKRPPRFLSGDWGPEKGRKK